MQQRGKADGKRLMKEFYTASKLRPVICLEFFRKAALLDQLRESGDVFWEQNGIVQEFLMALIAEHSSLSFMPPRASRENAIRDSAAPVRRAPKESLRNIVMSCGVAAALAGGTSVRPRGAVKRAVADGAVFDHVCLGS